MWYESLLFIFLKCQSRIEAIIRAALMRPFQTQSGARGGAAFTCPHKLHVSFSSINQINVVVENKFKNTKQGISLRNTNVGTLKWQSTIFLICLTFLKGRMMVGYNKVVKRPSSWFKAKQLVINSFIHLSTHPLSSTLTLSRIVMDGAYPSCLQAKVTQG